MEMDGMLVGQRSFKKKCHEGGGVYVLLVGLVQVAFLIIIALGINFPICTVWNAVPYLKGCSAVVARLPLSGERICLIFYRPVWYTKVLRDAIDRLIPDWS